MPTQSGPQQRIAGLVNAEKGAVVDVVFAKGLLPAINTALLLIHRAAQSMRCPARL